MFEGVPLWIKRVNALLRQFHDGEEDKKRAKFPRPRQPERKVMH